MVTDAVGDVMELSEAVAWDLVAMLILFGVWDFSDAFWMALLHKGERRFFTTRVGSKILWIPPHGAGRQRYSSNVVKLWRSVTTSCCRVLGRRHARLSLHVDDILVAFLDTLVGARRDFALVVLLWLALGLPLALKKTEFGRRVARSSGIFEAVTTRVTRSFGYNTEVTVLTMKNLRRNVIPIKSSDPRSESARRWRAQYLLGRLPSDLYGRR